MTTPHDNRRTDHSEIAGDGGITPSQTTIPSQTLPSHADDHDFAGIVCVVGLGYVGIPLAVRCAHANYRVLGYDVDPAKIETLRSGTDPTGDLTYDDILHDHLSYTTNPAAIADADTIVVAVPTPVDGNERPDLNYVESAARTIGTHLTPGTTIILESTVYPGATREVFIPTIVEHSHLTPPADFAVGYSPERTTPGDKHHTLADIVKVVSGLTEDNLKAVAAFYESIVDAGVHRAPSIEVAEASKVVENMQRDLNIAFVNELAMAFDRIPLDIQTHDVLEAARTKWNFHDYRPGLVGGHCIPVDPYYFTDRSKQAGFSPELVLTGRKVNEAVPAHVSNITIKALNQNNKAGVSSRVLVLGLTYKPGVPDIRTSKIGGVIDELQEYGVEVVGYDPVADPTDMRDVFGIDIQAEPVFDGTDAIILATPHQELLDIDLAAAATRMNPRPILVDVTGALDPTEVAAAGLAYRRL